jgi:uncharacterized membrane protein (UPF0182 family)
LGHDHPPTYGSDRNRRIPELKRVIVAHHNQIVMEETLERALDRLFPVVDGARNPTSAIHGSGS